MFSNELHHQRCSFILQQPNKTDTGLQLIALLGVGVTKNESPELSPRISNNRSSPVKRRELFCTSPHQCGSAIAWSNVTHSQLVHQDSNRALTAHHQFLSANQIAPKKIPQNSQFCSHFLILGARGIALQSLAASGMRLRATSRKTTFQLSNSFENKHNGTILHSAAQHPIMVVWSKSCFNVHFLAFCWAKKTCFFAQSCMWMN